MRTRVALAFSIASVLTLPGCEPPPPLYDRGQADTVQNAANLYISAYPAVPWTEIADKLEPKNNLTIAEARMLAAQTTQAQVNQFLSTFAAALAVGLPTRTKQITTTIKADNTEETTGTRVRGTGTVPASSGLPSTGIGDDALAADLAKSLANVPIDGSALLTLGTALYQQAQILDNQISKSLLPKGYEAYLVTFQVNMQPRKRNLSYDAYINLNLMPASWAEALKTSEKVREETTELPPIMVYPLVITDAMETTSVSRSIEAIRQAALQLSGVVGNVGVNAGVSGGSDRLNSVVGLDKNSLVTVGRVSDHTLRIRLGAENSGASGTAMVPRSYNISAVVLARSGTAPDRVSKLSVVTEMSLFSTESGEELGIGVSRRREELARRVARLVRSYGFGAISGDCRAGTYKEPEPSRLVRIQSQGMTEKAKSDEKSKQAEIGAALELLRAVDRSDYNKVATCLGLAKPGDELGPAKTGDEQTRKNRERQVQDELSLRRLISDLIDVQIDSRFSKLLIPLREPVAPKPPDDKQIVVMSDDAKSGTVVTLYGGEGFTAKTLTAELVFKDGYKLLPSAISVQGTPLETRITFPSVAQLKRPAGLEAKPLTLRLNETPPSQYLVASAPRDADPVKNPVQASQTVLIADAGGRAQATLLVGKFPDGTKGPLYLKVTGADLREDKTAGAVSPSAKGAPISAEQPVTLALGNLTPAKTVSVVTVDDKGKAIGEPIVFNVDRIAAK